MKPEDYGYRPATLSTVGGGGLEELYQQAVQEVFENIHNVNTDPDAKRKITIELIFKPNEERTEVGTAIVVKKSLAGVKGFTTRFHTAAHKKDGKFVILEHDPKQLGLLNPTQQIVERAAEITSQRKAEQHIPVDDRQQ